MKKLYPFHLLLFILLVSTSVAAQETASHVEASIAASVPSTGVPMYVNATKLNVRQNPSTDAKAIMALKAPSRVTLLEEDGEWNQISVNGTIGFVKSTYLVSSLEEVTAEGVDFDFAYQNPERVYHASISQSPDVTPRASARTVAKAKGSSVYFCNSGNVVKYHSSPNCRGLNRCSASVDPIPLKQAQSEMDPCKICY